MYSIGYDIGSSSVKASLLNLDTMKNVVTVFHPKSEMPIDAVKPGWAEQHPDQWWNSVKSTTDEILSSTSISSKDIKAIGISYQMHGLVLVDKKHEVLRPSIIWCDSRAVDIGRRAFGSLGEEYCLSNLLNSPGNFTASKLRWVKENEPEVYNRVYKLMLPGEYVALKMTGEVKTTPSGLSEGIFWNFKKHEIDTELCAEYEIENDVFGAVVPVFSEQGCLTKQAAEELGLAEGTPITYRAGDQPNNALSLNVFNPGDVAATAGTSGVVYGVSDVITYDPKSRVNTFAHVNHSSKATRLGILLCINGTGISNSWMKKLLGSSVSSYEAMNALAERVPEGSEDLLFVPFGNGAERMVENKTLGAHLSGIDFNRHTPGHVIRAIHEGIVFSFKYGMEIMSEMGMTPKIIRAGASNMFLSPIFRSTLATLTSVRIELYETDGSQGAARGAAIGTGKYSVQDVFSGLTRIEQIEPSETKKDELESAYKKWIQYLNKLYR